MQPQFNDEGAVPVGVPGALVLLLALPVLQLELSLYAGHATRKLPELADPKVSRPHVSLLLSDHTSRACTHPHATGLALFSSLTTISATLFSRFLIPADDVTVNWSSVQAVCLARVQPAVLACVRFLLTRLAH